MKENKIKYCDRGLKTINLRPNLWKNGQNIWWKMKMRFCASFLIRGILNWEFQSVGSKIFWLPIWVVRLLCKKVLYINGPQFSSKSMDSISYFSKIRGFHGPHASYAPADQTHLEVCTMLIRSLELLMWWNAEVWQTNRQNDAGKDTQTRSSK